jgi:hypothetical protein
MATTKWYLNAKKALANKEINWLSDDIRIMLCTSGYTPDQDNHAYKSSITNEVANGNGYTTGGVALTSKTSTVNGTTNVAAFDAADIALSAATFTTRWGVLYDNTPSTDATKPLIAFVDFGADQSPSNQTLNIVWNAAGILTDTVA